MKFSTTVSSFFLFPSLAFGRIGSEVEQESVPHHNRELNWSTGCHGVPHTIVPSGRDFRGVDTWNSPNGWLALYKDHNQSPRLVSNIDTSNEETHWRGGGSGLQVMQMQTDGNLVVYDDGCFIWCWRHAKWSTNTAGNPNAYLAVRDDYTLAIFKQGTCDKIWSSKPLCTTQAQCMGSTPDFCVDDPQDPNYQECQNKRATGIWCANDHWCQSNECRSNSCWSDNECGDSGQFKVNHPHDPNLGQCQPRRASGIWCWQDQWCASGNCVNAHCA